MRPLVVMLLLCFAGAVNSQVLRVGGAENIKLYGAAVISLLKSQGIASSEEYFPALRSFEMLRKGELDLEFPRTRRAVEPFADKVQLIGPISCVEAAVFAADDKLPPVRSLKDLERYRVGVSGGNAIVMHHLDSAGITYAKVPQPDLLPRMLLAGRFDVIVITRIEEGIAVRAMKGEWTIRRASPIIIAEPTYLVLRNRLELGAGIQQALDREKKAGQWQKRISEINLSLGFPADFGLSCISSR